MTTVVGALSRGPVNPSHTGPRHWPRTDRQEGRRTEGLLLHSFLGIEIVRRLLAGALLAGDRVVSNPALQTDRASPGC